MESHIALPPVELMNRVGLVPTREPEAEFLAIGAAARASILRHLPADWSFAGRRVLDFGCGAGRVLRHFRDEARVADEFWGCEIHAPSVEWAQRHLTPPFRVRLTDEAPPLAFDDGHFDLVYALSVFTHLADYWAEWLLELHRVLRPGGLLVVTLLGADRLELDTGELALPRRVGCTALEPGQSWDEGGPLVYVSDWWLRAHWGRGFDVVAGELDERAEPDPVLDQRVVLLRRRPERPSLTDLLAPVPNDPREIEAFSHGAGILWRHETARRTEITALVRGLHAEIARLQREAEHWRHTALAWEDLFDATVERRLAPETARALPKAGIRPRLAGLLRSIVGPALGQRP